MPRAELLLRGSEAPRRLSSKDSHPGLRAGRGTPTPALHRSRAVGSRGVRLTGREMSLTVQVTMATEWGLPGFPVRLGEVPPARFSQFSGSVSVVWP